MDESIEKLARRLADAVPDGIKSVRGDLEQSFRSLLDGWLSRLDLVTREEFEVQEAVLARTRSKLEALEEQLSALEAAGAAPPPKKKTAAKKKTKKKTTKKKTSTAAKQAADADQDGAD